MNLNRETVHENLNPFSISPPASFAPSFNLSRESNRVPRGEIHHTMDIRMVIKDPLLLSITCKGMVRPVIFVFPFAAVFSIRKLYYSSPFFTPKRCTSAVSSPHTVSCNINGQNVINELLSFVCRGLISHSFQSLESIAGFPLRHSASYDDGDELPLQFQIHKLSPAISMVKMWWLDAEFCLQRPYITFMSECRVDCWLPTEIFRFVRRWRWSTFTVPSPQTVSCNINGWNVIIGLLSFICRGSIYCICFGASSRLLASHWDDIPLRTRMETICLYSSKYTNCPLQ